MVKRREVPIVTMRSTNDNAGKITVMAIMRGRKPPSKGKKGVGGKELSWPSYMYTTS